MRTVFDPTFNVIAPDAEPLVTATPSTVIVALGSFVVGVTVTLVTLLPTLSVYEVVLEAKTGLKVPELTVRLLNVASVEEAVLKLKTFPGYHVPPTRDHATK